MASEMKSLSYLEERFEGKILFSEASDDYNKNQKMENYKDITYPVGNFSSSDVAISSDRADLKRPDDK